MNPPELGTRLPGGMLVGLMEDGVQLLELEDGRIFAMHPNGEKLRDEPTLDEAMMKVDIAWSLVPSPPVKREGQSLPRRKVSRRRIPKT